jgi:hypothetical protein
MQLRPKGNVMETDSSLDLLIQQIKQAASKNSSSALNQQEACKAHGKYQGVDPVWDKLMAKLNEGS